MKPFLKYLYVFAFMALTLFGVSQPNTKREKIEALRVTFISQRVNFTTAEAQQFWPLYNEYNDKLDANRKAFRQLVNKTSVTEFATDKDADLYLNAELTLKQKEYELYKEYYEKFKKVLPIKKVALLRKSEDDFKKELIKNIKGNSPE